MTNRINGLYVALEKDIRDDDIEHLKLAIGMLRGVLDVETNVADLSEFVASRRIRHELQTKLFEVLK